MNLSVTFRRAARAEFIEAAACYESQRPRLGVEFIAEIERCVDAAAERPTTYAAIDKEERRIVVLAVFHGRRNPVIWQERT